MAVSTVFAWFWLLPNEMRSFSQSLVAVSTFTSNFLFYLASGYFGADSVPLLHTWSLSVEEQFYVIFPVLLLLTWRFGRSAIILLLTTAAIASFANAQWVSGVDESYAFLLFPTRFWELLLGSLVALYLSSNTMNCSRLCSDAASLAGLLSIAFSVVIFTENTPFPGVYTLLPTLGTVLIILFATPDTLTGKLLQNRVFVLIGLISYSAYLWHQPLLAFAQHRFAVPPDGLILVGLVTVNFAFAYLSWRYVELPFRDRSRFTRRSVFGAAAAVSAAFITFGLFGHFNGGFDKRFSEEVLATHITRQHEILLRNAGCKLAPSGSFDYSTCMQGAATKSTSVALVGDSHAASLVHELGESFREVGNSFVPLVKSGCPINFFLAAKEGTQNQRDCSRYQQKVVEEIDNISTFIIFLRKNFNTTQVSLGEKHELESNIKSIQELLRLGKEVVLVYPIPTYETEISDYMAKNLLFYDNRLEMITMNRQQCEENIAYYYQRFDAIGEQPGLTRVRTKDIFCDRFEKDVCVTQVDGVPLYFDDNHLSNAGARLVVAEIMDTIG